MRLGNVSSIIFCVLVNACRIWKKNKYIESCTRDKHSAFDTKTAALAKPNASSTVRARMDNEEKAPLSLREEEREEREEEKKETSSPLKEASVTGDENDDDDAREKTNATTARTTPPTTKEQKQSRTNELSLHEQWRSIQRAERRKTREERKERREIAKERLVDRLDERTEKLDRELDVAEKQTRAMAKAHLETAERIYDAALKCKEQMRMDLEMSMRKAFAAFAKESEEVRKAHEERVAVAERAMKEMKMRFENQEINVHFPRHASTMAEIKNQAEEERANLRSTLGARLERVKRDIIRASGCESERPALQNDRDGVRDSENGQNNSSDSDFENGDVTDLDKIEEEELMTFLNTDATAPSLNAYHPKLLHHRFRRINRIKDAKIQRMEEHLSKLTREREKWQRKTASLERNQSEDASRIETQTRAALRQARDLRRARAKRSKERVEKLKQRLSAEYSHSRSDGPRNGFSSSSFLSKSDAFWALRDAFHRDQQHRSTNSFLSTSFAS